MSIRLPHRSSHYIPAVIANSFTAIQSAGTVSLKTAIIVSLTAQKLARPPLKAGLVQVRYPSLNMKLVVITPVGADTAKRAQEVLGDAETQSPSLDNTLSCKEKISP